jgi:hypothetical protein
MGADPLGNGSDLGEQVMSHLTQLLSNAANLAQLIAGVSTVITIVIRRARHPRRRHDPEQKERHPEVS